MRVTLSPAARDDLIEIGVYIAQDNPNRALNFIDGLHSSRDIGDDDFSLMDA